MRWMLLIACLAFFLFPASAQDKNFSQMVNGAVSKNLVNGVLNQFVNFAFNEGDKAVLETGAIKIELIVYEETGFLAGFLLSRPKKGWTYIYSLDAGFKDYNKVEQKGVINGRAFRISLALISSVTEVEPTSSNNVFRVKHGENFASLVLD